MKLIPFLLLFACDIVDPVYFTVHNSDCGYRLYPHVEGAYFLNDSLIGSWCAKPVLHANLCTAVAGDTVSVDAGRDMTIDYFEILE